ncbi:MAG: 3-phosphoshikimate 1-carboxyvinyltransferase [Bacillota bacterium]|nr:3-phosphoshikimate 1-carboxyvinyltransferase [Bacillota bacterium]
MSNISVSPSKLNGTVIIPPSKSAAHRAILCAALSRGVTKLSPVQLSEDIDATIRCIEALGAVATLENQTLTVDGRAMFTKQDALLNCKESGSTLRFLIPITAFAGINATFTGEGRLPTRPIGVYLDTLPKHGVTLNTSGGLPLSINGHLASGTFLLPGDVSSQFITGLLFALPLLEGDSEIRLTTPLESVGYIDMTLKILKDFGIEIQRTNYGYFISGNQSYCQKDEYQIESDWSQAAFFMVAGALGGNVTVQGLDINSTQGDKEIIEILKKFGANISITDNGISVSADAINGTTIDARQIPDLVPILAVIGSLSEGVTKIIGAARLRLKESDRLNAIANALNALGGNVVETEDGLIIQGTSKLHGGFVSGCNDHRIVMAMAIAATKCDGSVIISDRESINKSYPTFFEDYIMLGGKINGLNLG